MKENVLDVLMFLFENYLYDEPEETPDRDSLEENLHQAGFTNGEIEKAFMWLDGLAEQRHQPDGSVDGGVSTVRRALTVWIIAAFRDYASCNRTRRCG